MQEPAARPGRRALLLLVQGVTSVSVVDNEKFTPNSGEDAAREALTDGMKTLRNPRVAEVSEFDLTVSDTGEIKQFRTKLKVSFKYESD